jgi:hypothetical protein
VTATALDIALRCTSGGVFLAGMDLSNNDIKTHARPYAFDRFGEERATRLEPRYSHAFVRSGMIAASGSYRVYAEWFGSQAESYSGRIRALGKNNPVFDRFRRFSLPDGGESRQSSQPSMRQAELAVRSPAGAGADAVRVLTGCPDEVWPALCKELGPLLLPGDEAPTRDRLCREIEALTLRKGMPGDTPDG